MQILSRGRQIGQAVKNVPRLRHIVGIFAKNGFGEILSRIHVAGWTPFSRLQNKVEGEPDSSPQERLRKTFEELGPTFVKLGQLLSSRPDLVPEAYVEEFKKLQDQVAPISYEQVKSVIESELKQPIEFLFDDFDQNPLASASISQVHAATLKSGEEVVVKVQRPGIERTIKSDLSILNFLAGLLEKAVPELRVLRPTAIVDEFFRTLTLELDFYIEANNITRITANLSKLEDIVIPQIYKAYSSSRVLTLEKIKGVPFNDVAAIDRLGVDKRQIVRVGAMAFFRQVLLDGIFHGDLHAGNLFVLSDGKIGLIDFGIVGRISPRSRDRLANILLSLLNEDYENLCYQFAELGTVLEHIDFEAFQRDIQNTVAPYLGLTMSEINAGKILIETTKVATRYNIRVPGEWMIVFKALFTMEGMGRTLDPTFDFLELGQEMTKELVKSQYSMAKIQKELFWSAKDIVGLVQSLPRQMRWMFKKFNSNDFAVEVKINELSEIRRQSEINSKRNSLSVIIAGILISLGILFSQGNEALIDSKTFVTLLIAVLAGLTVRLFFR